MTATLDEELIAEHVDPDPHGRGPAEARLSEHGTSVWALVAYWRGRGGTEAAVEESAADYELPVEAVRAALAYYRRHQDVIDARVLLNEAA